MDPEAASLDHIEALLRARRSAAAEEAARQLTSRSARPEARILLGRALQQQGRFAEALRAIEALRGAANASMASHPGAALLRAECLLQTGALEQALDELRALEREASSRPRVLQDIGALYSHLNLHVEAEACYARAAELAPSDPQASYNWSTCLIALGRLDQAEELLDRVIAIAPHDHDAYYNRSTLRRQTREQNHVAELERVLHTQRPSPNAQIAVGYALAKELEDLGRFGESFAALKSAADSRRRVLSYRVEDDVETMKAIAREFDGAWCARALAARAPAPQRPMIFVVGLPRSGTTLVDRILSSHSRVHSRGESSDFAAAVMLVAGAASDKPALIKQVAQKDSAELGRNYCARLPFGADILVDKTPMNFLYTALIAAALPDARIVHVRRGPVDVCYAMYKTLFRMAYPFSYDLADLASYYAAYVELMAHWREVLGERLVEIDYEDLVANQQTATRRLLERCGLPWEDACLAFHRNASPSLTASAAQVRQPIYRSSVDLWRRYERELQPLLAHLKQHGVDVGEAAA